MQSIDLFSADFVANISNDIMMEIAKSGRVLFFNTKASCIFAGIGKHKFIKDILSEDKYEVLKQNIEMAFYQQYPHHFYWGYQGRFYLIYIYPQNFSVWLCMNDITEKRQQAHLLHSCGARNDFIEKLLVMGYWELDVDKKRFYWSEGVYDIFEISNEEKNSNINFIKKHVYCDDLPIYKNELKKLLKNKEKISGKIRIVTKSENIKVCKFVADFMFENGKTKIAGIFQDVGENSVESEDLFFYEKKLHDLKHYFQLINLQLSDLLCDETYIGLCDTLKTIAMLLNLNDCDLFGACSFDIEEFVKKIAKKYEILAENSKLKFDVKTNKAIVRQNEFLLERIIFNLLINAFKFAKSKVVLRNGKNYVWIGDDGHGIGTKNCKNDGKGLKIVEECAAKANIKVKIRSCENKYTIFKLAW